MIATDVVAGDVCLCNGGDGEEEGEVTKEREGDLARL